VKNPLRSEADAFQFLLGAAAYFGLIAIAGVINAWAGLVVFIVLTAAVLVWWMRARRHEVPQKETPRRRGGPDERRVLVVANETVGGEALLSTVERVAQPGSELLVVAPAMPSQIRHWTSDVDGARGDAERRLQASVSRLEATGLVVRGEIGDDDPLVAIADALRTFGADEIVISTHPEGRSHWLEQDLIGKAQARFALPITHVVVDLAAEQSPASRA
jgi:Ca2+/Na+ antiporter